jgi:tetratricopeptide (TPR) repeat protein
MIQPLNEESSSTMNRQCPGEEERLNKRARVYIADEMERAAPVGCTAASQVPSLKSQNKPTPQQKQECGEGMDIYYKGPFPTKGDVSDTARSATILYNSGQNFLQEEKYKEAKKWFALASLRLKLAGNAAEALPLLVRVLHNMGYCYHRLGNNEDAMRCFKTALAFAEQAGIGEIDEAPIKNCIQALEFSEDSRCALTDLSACS